MLSIVYPIKVLQKKQVQRMLDKIPYDTITTKNLDIGSYNRNYAALDVDESQATGTVPLVDSGGDALKNKRKKRRTLRATTATKVPFQVQLMYMTQVAQYERTFQRRQQAAKDRLRNLRRQKIKGAEAKERIIEAMSFEDSTGQKRIRGPVRGAALSRFVEKS